MNSSDRTKQLLVDAAVNAELTKNRLDVVGAKESITTDEARLLLQSAQRTVAALQGVVNVIAYEQQQTK